MKKRIIWKTACIWSLVSTGAMAAVYSDPAGDSVGSPNGDRDIVGAIITSNATDLFISIELNPTAVTNNNSGVGGSEAAANLATSAFNYCIGITTGPGADGDTENDATTHGNPYDRNLSIASTLGGMTDWIGAYGAGGSGSSMSPYTSYGFNDYVFGNPGSTSPAGVWTKEDTVNSGEPISSTGDSSGDNTISLTVPIADFAANLSLTPGTTIYFDIYTTGTSTLQTAYDSLADDAATQTGTYNGTAQYNGLVLDSYTVPEPAAMGALVIAAGAMLGRRTARKKLAL